MKNGNNTNNVNKHLNKTRLDLPDHEQWDEFAIQAGMLPYTEVGTGRRCKVKGCTQPVYDVKLRLCSLHRMEEAERAFEDRLKARRQQAMIERNKH